MNKLVNCIVEVLNTVAHPVWLGVSGGMDSMVMLDVCARAYQNGMIKKPIICHVNHHLNSNADKWAKLVENKAVFHGFKFYLFHIKVPAVALEETARALRYQAIFSKMEALDVLLTAHHLQDQRETFIFRAFRGTGIKGLVGIRSKHILYGKTVIRPFYQVSQSDLYAYACENKLTWEEDPSNQDISYKRNNIRQALQLIDSQAFSLTQTHLQRQSEVLSLLLDEKLSSMLKESHILSLSALKKEDSGVQLELFHHWLSKHDVVISHHQSLAILQAISTARLDRYPCEHFGQLQLLRYRDNIALLRLPEVDLRLQSHECEINLGIFGKIYNPCGYALSITLLKDGKSQYKKKLQSKSIPLWLRGYIPMIEGKLIWEYKHCQWMPPREWQFWFDSLLEESSNKTE